MRKRQILKSFPTKSGEKRILINLYHEEDAAFFIFDVEGNLILKKEGKFTQDRSFFGYKALDDDNHGKRTGLYDEITGKEVLPCQYLGMKAYRKKAEHSGHFERDEILLAGIQLSNETVTGYKIDYFHYDPQSGEVSALTDTQMLPLDRVMDCAKLGYEDLRDAEFEYKFSTEITLDSLDPEITGKDKKKM